MGELLNLDYLTVLEEQYVEFKAGVVRHNWTDQNLNDERNLWHQLQQHEGYRLLVPEVFKTFKRELRLGKATIDPVEIIERLDNNLDELFNLENNVGKAGKYYMQDFIDNVKAIGGYMSGSLVLKHILQEEWPTTDIDIYVNETMLKGMLTVNHPNRIYPDNHPALQKVREAQYAISLGLTSEYFGLIENTPCASKRG